MKSKFHSPQAPSTVLATDLPLVQASSFGVALCLAGSLLMPQDAGAATFVWDGNGTGGTTMNVTANWNPNGVPAATAGDTGQFDGSVPGNLSLTTSGASANTNP